VKRLIGLVAVAFLISGCSGTPTSTDVLSATASSLGEIHSGTLHLRVVVSTAPGEGESSVGFEIEGPFELAAEGELPVAQLDYTQFTDDDEVSATLTSTGEEAFATVEGETVELGPEQLDVLRSAGGSVGSSGLDQLDVGRWIEDASLADGGHRGGADTYLVTGGLNAVEALNGMVDAAQGFGAAGAAGLDRLEGADADLLDAIVSSSSIKVYSGKEDELLRELDLEVDFQASGTDELLDALGPLSGASLSLTLAIDDPNSDIEVDAPEQSR
jgi:hypothetical protein